MSVSSLRGKTQAVRRAHVLQAALGVFAERGYRGATIRDVARAAGVSDGTIYNTFENKGALLLALLEPLEAAPSKTIKPPSCGSDLATRVSEMIRLRWEGYTPEMLAVLRVVLAEVLISQELRGRFFARVLKPALDGAESLFSAERNDGDTERSILSSRIVTGQILGLLLLRLLDDEKLERCESLIPHRLAELFEKGIE